MARRTLVGPEGRASAAGAVRCRRPRGARRGTYRIVYRIDDTNLVVHILDIDHRLEIYHRPR
jgi:hypothetical protein